MFFTKGRRYTIITKEQADILVERDILEATTKFGVIAYLHRETPECFLTYKMLGRTFIASDSGLKTYIRNAVTYVIHPWMCKEYYNSLLMETE